MCSTVKKLANANITWYKVSPLVKDWLDSTDSESALSANCGRLLKEELDTKSTNTHKHDTLYMEADTRKVATDPTNYRRSFKFVGLKEEETIGLSSGATYVTLFGFRDWDDDTGSGAYELAFTSRGRIFIRHQLGDRGNQHNGDFGNWYEIPIIETSTSDLIPGSSNLENGHLYLVYE